MKVAERMVGLSPRFLDLAEQHPDHAIALDSLVQVVLQEIWLETNTLHPGRGTDSLEDRAIALLLEHHVGSDRLGDVCRQISFGFRRSCETFLKTVLATNPHREVRGLACLRLAQFLNGRLRRLDLIDVRPEMAERYRGLFGTDHLEELRRRDKAAAVAEIESIFTRAADEFGDIGLPYGGKVSATAQSELHEIRHLSIGSEALEIESEDQNGAVFKLTELRGKVVLLYFWSEH